MKPTFKDLGIGQALADVLRADHVVQPTRVQEEAIPIIASGHDVIVQAQTGTGKTLAFLLPIMQAIQPDNREVQALIVTPTRELALQITDEARKLSGPAGVEVLAAYGGQDVIAQIHKLQEAPHLVIGTPGRLLDHLRRETIRLDRLRMLVLDEADQMLHLGFLPEVEAILEQTPDSRQTLLFSATMPDHVRRLASHYMRDTRDVRVEGKRVTLDEIEQAVIETTDRAKQATLASMLTAMRPFLAVVFCRTKIRAKKLNAALQAMGVESDELHGDLTQAKREQVMQRFREAKLRVLVATDVAARGLDVEGVTHVFNYDIPHDAESYIHRIGRTGRAGQYGAAFTFAAPRDAAFLREIEQTIGMELARRTWNVPETQSSRSGREVPERHTDRREPARSGRSVMPNGQRAPVRTGARGTAGGGAPPRDGSAAADGRRGREPREPREPRDSREAREPRGRGGDGPNGRAYGRPGERSGGASSGRPGDRPGNRPGGGSGGRRGR